VSPLLTQKQKDDAFAARMKGAEAYVFADTPEPWRKVKGSGTLTPPQLERLEAVWRRREALAQELDLAPWRLVPSEELLHWAREGCFSENSLIDPKWSNG